MVQAAAAVMSAVQHESSQLIVVSAVIDGHVCQDVLVDAGASSNFVREDWVKSTRLSTRRMRETLKVTLADGKVAAQLTHAVQARSLEMQGSSAPCTLTVMGQLSHQVIVGLPWLRRAGVTIDYEHMQWNGQPIDQGKLKTTPGAQLQGLTVGPEHTKRMDAILATVSGGLQQRPPSEIGCRRGQGHQGQRSPEGPQLQTGEGQGETEVPSGHGGLEGCSRGDAGEGPHTSQQQ